MRAGIGRIRLLACDVDGTLLGKDLQISLRVQQAIARARDAGVHVVLATGRMPAATRSYVDLLQLHGPQIYYNGALVATPDGASLFHLPIDLDVARAVIKRARAEQLHLNAYVGDTIYVDRLTPEAEFTRQLNRVDPVPVGDLLSFLVEAPTKLVIVRLPRVEDGLISRLAAALDGPVSISSSVPQYCEIINSAVDKGRALRALAEHLGLRIDEVAAIGDGDNDATLLKAAGVAFAMGNATPGLKSLADVVVESVDDDGVAEAIDRYILRSLG